MRVETEKKGEAHPWGAPRNSVLAAHVELALDAYANDATLRAQAGVVYGEKQMSDVCTGLQNMVTNTPTDGLQIWAPLVAYGKSRGRTIADPAPKG